VSRRRGLAAGVRVPEAMWAARFGPARAVSSRPRAVLCPSIPPSLARRPPRSPGSESWRPASGEADRKCRCPRITSGTDTERGRMTMRIDSTQPLGTPTWIDLGIPDLDRAMAFYGPRPPALGRGHRRERLLRHQPAANKRVDKLREVDVRGDQTAVRHPASRRAEHVRPLRDRQGHRAQAKTVWGVQRCARRRTNDPRAQDPPGVPLRCWTVGSRSPGWAWIHPAGPPVRSTRASRAVSRRPR
jgi:hypothetical protein